MASHADPTSQHLDQSRRVKAADYSHFRAKLQARMGALRSSISKALSQSESERDIRLAGQVHDAKDDAFAELLAEVDTALVSHEIAEVRDIEAAQGRMNQGTYGHCVDCSAEIEWGRLEARPSAPRCLPCQQDYEQR